MKMRQIVGCLCLTSALFFAGSLGAQTVPSANGRIDVHADAVPVGRLLRELLPMLSMGSIGSSSRKRRPTGTASACTSMRPLAEGTVCAPKDPAKNNALVKHKQPTICRIFIASVLLPAYCPCRRF